MATLKYKTNNGYEPLPAMVVRKTNAENGNGIGTCSTSSGTALTVSLTNYELVQNGFVAVTFENDVPAGATLNINSKGAKPIIYKGSAITADTIKADDTALFSYDGSSYVLCSSGAGGAAPINPNEKVNITLTQVGGNSADLTGATITITDDDSGDTLLDATWNGSTITTEIDVNTNYTVSVETITGYLACSDQSYQAGYQTERSISFQYAALGVFIESTDYQLYTKDQWASSGKTVNAIVVITEKTQFRLHPTLNINKPIHSNSTDPLTNYLPAKSATEEDYDGEGNTNKILQFNTAYGTNNTNYAAPYATSTLFPDGVTHGMILSNWQLRTLSINKTAIIDCLSACGGVTLTLDYVWSSTAAGTSSVYDVNLNINYMTTQGINSNGYFPRLGAPYN